MMFFCTKCEPKVNLPLNFFADVQQKQQAIDDKLKQLEEQVDSSLSKNQMPISWTTNDVTIKSREQKPITKECIAIHTN